MQIGWGKCDCGLAGNDLRALCEGGYARGYMDATAGVVVGGSQRGRGVKSDPNRECEAMLAAVPLERALNLDGTRDRAWDVSERDEESVARVRDLLAPMPAEETAQCPVVSGAGGHPRVVADRRHEIG